MPRFKLALAVGGLALTGAGFALWPHQSQAEAPIVPPGLRPAKTVAQPAPAVSLDLAAALQQNRVQLELSGNGKDKLTFTARNLGSEAIRLHVPAGQLFASSKSTVALVRSRDLEIAPGTGKSEDLATVATASGNENNNAAFLYSAAKLPRLDALFAYLDEHAEVPLAAAQIATLALTENLPVSAFAKFAMPDGGSPSRLDTKALKADTCDIIAALMTLREVGLDQQLALTIDPQLKIEAMIDPLAHALAVRYYRIGDEWAYWRAELLEGNPATRHYALYGIARFYPDVALQMLPKWARADQATPVFRTSAIQALAETQRAEALSILRQLETELGTATDFGKTAHLAANFLDAQFTKSPATKISVAFRASQSVSPQKSSLAATN